jgi:phosphomannomutase
MIISYNQNKKNIFSIILERQILSFHTPWFGTDGVRAMWGNEPFTNFFIIKLCESLHTMGYMNPKKVLLLGRDPRITGMFVSQWIASKAKKYGVHIIDVGIVSTPALASMMPLCQAHIGIMITASHNDVFFQGLKIFQSTGEKWTQEQEQMLESLWKKSCISEFNFQGTGVQTMRMPYICDVLKKQQDQKKNVSLVSFSYFLIQKKELSLFLKKRKKNVCTINKMCISVNISLFKNNSLLLKKNHVVAFPKLLFDTGINLEKNFVQNHLSESSTLNTNVHNEIFLKQDVAFDLPILLTSMDTFSSPFEKSSNWVQKSFNMTSNSNLSPVFHQNYLPTSSELRKDYAIRLWKRFCNLSFNGKKIVIDGAHGSVALLAINLFKRLGADVIPLGNRPGLSCINQGCGSHQADVMEHMVKTHKAHFGIAFDGDGDRVILCTAQGYKIDGDQILAFLCNHAKTTHEIEGQGYLRICVGTIMSNGALEAWLEKRHWQLRRTSVGDRAVANLMKQFHAPWGGEPSGHIIFSKWNTSVSDGLYTALSILEMIFFASGNYVLDAIFPCFQPWTSYSWTWPHPIGFWEQWGKYILSYAQYLQIHHALGGRTVIRPSGTEPVIRFLLETHASHIHVKNFQNELIIFYENIFRYPSILIQNSEFKEFYNKDKENNDKLYEHNHFQCDVA